MLPNSVRNRYIAAARPGISKYLACFSALSRHLFSSEELEQTLWLALQITLPFLSHYSSFHLDIFTSPGHLTLAMEQVAEAPPWSQLFVPR